jgi:RNA polymerase sigma-70 factor (ECF subfamily)
MVPGAAFGCNPARMSVGGDTSRSDRSMSQEVSASQIAEHVPRMYRLALRMLGDDEQAREVVQEACLKALSSLHSFDGRSGMATWLHRITVNCAMDALRRTSRTRQVKSDVALKEMMARMEAGPATAAEIGELAGMATAMLAKLPDECRSAFALTQLDGFSYDEAAAIENQPRGTIASRVHRAKRILLEQMEKTPATFDRGAKT